MKHTICLFLLLLLLLPAMAQKPFTARVVAGKDYPYYITAVKAQIPTFLEGEERRYGADERVSFQKLDNRTYCLSYDAKRNTSVFFNIELIDQEGNQKSIFSLLHIPLIPGENIEVTLHDEWNIEIGGSQLYREYGKAQDAIMQQGVSPSEYVARHRKERGCAMFVISSNIQVLFDEFGDMETRHKLFAPATVRFFGDPEDRYTWSDIYCAKASEERWRIGYFDNVASSRLTAFDRQLEGQAIIDSIGQQNQGEPTLVSIWTYRTSNTTPDAHELYLHAHGMKQVHLTSIDETSKERYWKQEAKHYEGDHYLMMRYQVDSLFQMYMPGVVYPVLPCRAFYILLDAEGKVVAHGDRRHDYRKLISLTDELKEKAGLPPFKKKPYEIKQLDMDTTKLTVWDTNEIIREAKLRMSYWKQSPIEGHEQWNYNALALYSTTAKQLNISQRLYDALSKHIEEEDRERRTMYVKSRLDYEERKRKQSDDYKPDLEQYRKDMAVGHPVDLGLSILWADMNVGAKAAEETGMYFTWGDPEPIQNTSAGRNWHNYRWSNESAKSLRKYNTKSENGAVDMRTTVLAEDDAAAIYWQGGWRTPTYEEADELWKKCTWERTEQNGVKGYRVTGPNGNSIFLPYTGCLNYQGLYGVGEHGYFWTSSINTEEPQNAYYLAGHSYEVKGILYNFGDQERYAGRCIRPVYQKTDNQ